MVCACIKFHIDQFLTIFVKAPDRLQAEKGLGEMNAILVGDGAAMEISEDAFGGK